MVTIEDSMQAGPESDENEQVELSVNQNHNMLTTSKFNLVLCNLNLIRFTSR